MKSKTFQAVVQKGNALLGLGQLDKARKCFESLRELGKGATADRYLQKVDSEEKKGKKKPVQSQSQNADKN